ncbi:hypothetical protein TKK_0012125 [Trichogramma kaykai]|uniref:Uncharacterized protein n=1 Tax=Trichogramma kaykai TaxID=54128 RepID=A0ABD2WN07_9HYME
MRSKAIIFTILLACLSIAIAEDFGKVHFQHDINIAVSSNDEDQQKVESSKNDKKENVVTVKVGPKAGSEEKPSAASADMSAGKRQALIADLLVTISDMLKKHPALLNNVKSAASGEAKAQKENCDE